MVSGSSPSETAPVRDGYGYPLFRSNARRLPADWTGPLYVWDIDNTYLLTEWTTLRDLIRIRFLESAADKRPVPGAVELLGALRRGAGLVERPAFYFVSASPEAMRATLEKRMLLDGVLHDGITFRDLHRLRYLRDIYGYKLAALLLYRRENPARARETLFGDDREHDPWIYTDYARICAGTLRGAELRAALAERRVGQAACRYIATLADELPAVDPVDWVVIRRLPATPPDRPAPPSDRLVYVDDFAQAAAFLRGAGLVDRDGLSCVVGAVGRHGGSTLAALEAAAGRLAPEAVAEVRRELEALARP